jgi:parallel beta helix pectate lyase-like protein
VADGDTLRGADFGSTLRASASFKGRAVVVLASGATVERLTIEGNRAKLASALPIPPYDRAFADFYPNNGILSAGTHDVTIRDVKLRNIANLAIVVSAAQGVTIERVQVFDSGSLNEKGRNNTTGGILLEEGTTEFLVQNCSLENIRGNGVWTHSRKIRNAKGRITGNRFLNIGRDAIQVGHATEIRVDQNTGSQVGYPYEVVDTEGGGTPVAIDTAGNVDKSVYEQNEFLEINGKCIDLDGFHHGDVLKNTCRNKLAAEQYPVGSIGIVLNNSNPGMQSESVRLIGNIIDGVKFSGLFVIGSGHTIQGNQMLRLNQAGCNESHAKFGCLYNPKEPGLLESGIYLSKHGERVDPSRQNTISGNIITGFKMAERCIVAAPGVDLNSNTIKENVCKNQ